MATNAVNRYSVSLFNNFDVRVLGWMEVFAPSVELAIRYAVSEFRKRSDKGNMVELRFALVGKNGAVANKQYVELHGRTDLGRVYAVPKGKAA